MTLAVDPIVISVIQHRLLAIVEEMGEAMLRTSYSQILNSSRDFSTAICDLDGRLIAQAEHVPIHVGALPFAAKAVTEFFGDDIHQGDVFLLNDPYHGGNHLPDLTAFVPVFEGPRTTAALLVDQPGASERYRRRDARRLQRRRDRHLAGGHPHHAVAALRPRRGAPRSPRDDRDQCAPPARLPRRSRGDDRLGACRRAAPLGIGGRIRLADGQCRDRGGARRRRAPDPRGHRRNGGTASTTARRCSTMTAAATATSISARPSPNAAATS